MNGKIKHLQEETRGSFIYLHNDQRLAEMAYTMVGQHRMIIDHTDVDDSLRGQGIGKQLLGALVDYVRTSGIQVIPLCPFAKATFKKTIDWQDVLMT